MASISMIDWVKVLRPTRHKTDHFELGDVILSQSLGLVLKKTKSNTTKANLHPYQNILQHKINTKKTGLVASCDLWPGNWTGLFWNEYKSGSTWE